MLIRKYLDKQDRQAVVALWKGACGYSAAHNDPSTAIDRKVKEGDDLFFVAVDGQAVLGTVMAGYDGHRGRIYSLAVVPEARRQGVGTALMRHAESILSTKGCPKVNLQVGDTNGAVTAFYEKLGYSAEPRISMGKLLPDRRSATG
jgi:hypothetical protein